MGDFSTVTRIKLEHLLDVFCKDIDIRIVFSSFKIRIFFSFKDPIPDALKSLVVYQFTCAGCDSRYIGETSRHFATHNSSFRSDEGLALETSAFESLYGG